MRRVLLVVAAVLGGALAAFGIWCSTAERAGSFGWTAYTPLDAGAVVVPVGPPAWAIALVVAGSVAVGAALALLLARRPR